MFLVFQEISLYIVTHKTKAEKTQECSCLLLADEELNNFFGPSAKLTHMASAFYCCKM